MQISTSKHKKKSCFDTRYDRDERLKDKKLREEAKERNTNQEEINSGNFYVVREDLWDRHLGQKKKGWIQRGLR